MIHIGDCRELMAAMEPDSIDACVTDPPYHLTSIVKRFGSPTAAMDEGFEFIGCELSPEYAATANKRIADRLLA